MKVIVEFLTGKRKTPPFGDFYRPHFVIKRTTDYLGIQFEHLDNLPFGTHIICKVKLLYDDVDYSKLIANTPFFVMEGARVVGEGTVLD